MRHGLVVASACSVVVGGLAGAPALVGLGTGVAPASAGARNSHILVYAQEWSLYSSRATVPAGTVGVELWNRGEDPHDLRVRRIRDGRLSGPVDGAVGLTQSGGLTRATWRLAPGRYQLYCALPQHRSRGMRIILLVR
jgi:hypothetical protein